MEGSGHAVWPVDICAAGVGSGNIRQRLFWVAFFERLGNSNSPRTSVGISEPKEWEKGITKVDDDGSNRLLRSGEGRSAIVGLADSNSNRREETRKYQPETGNDGVIRDSTISRVANPDSGTRAQHEHQPGQRKTKETNNASISTGIVGGLEDAGGDGRGERRNGDNGRHVGRQSNTAIKVDRPGPTNGFWGDADWLFCRDGKWRPVEPSTFPLVNGAPARVGRLCGYGNAINAEVAKTFIEAVMEVGA